MTRAEPVQNFGEVAACLFLNEQCRHKKAHIDRRNPLRHIQQRIAKRKTEVLLFERRAKLARDRFRRFFRDHFKARRERVACANGTAKQIERLRESFFKCAKPLLPQVHHDAVRHRAEAKSDQYANRKNRNEKSGSRPCVPRQRHALIKMSLPAFIVSPACEIFSCNRTDHDQCSISR